MGATGEVSERIWSIVEGDGPFVATAVHDGHAARGEVAQHFALDDAARLREEDPYTGEWTAVAPTRVVATHSRFEVDLNRPREKAVYRVPDDAWGLDVWKAAPPAEMFERSLGEYDQFYVAMKDLLESIVARHGRVLVFDLHSYNHRRDGPDGEVAAVAENPQVNIGTGTINGQRWAPVVDTFIERLRDFDFPGGKLDVRENVKFRGGNWPRWVNDNFPETGVAIAIEFKKFFMDEWIGVPDRRLVDAIGAALRSTVEETVAAFSRA